MDEARYKAVANAPDEVDTDVEESEDENLSLSDSYARQLAADEEGNATALVQLQKGQVGLKRNRDIPRGLQVAIMAILTPFSLGKDAIQHANEQLALLVLGFFAVLGVVITIFVLFWPVAMWFLTAAVTIAAGLTTWSLVKDLLSSKHKPRPSAVAQ